MSFEMKNVNKTIHGQTILSDINMTVGEGECCGFVGRNGCGKTMLLRAAAGYMSVDGTVTWKSKPIGNGSFIENAGIIIGETDLIYDLSGHQNLKCLAEINNRIDDERIIEVIRSVGLIDAKDKKYKKYSLGMKQRLRIAQAIMEYPDILILDEPFNGLDKQGSAEMIGLLQKLKNDGVTILLTSHNELDIQKLCDKFYEMDNAKIISGGSL